MWIWVRTTFDSLRCMLSSGYPLWTEKTVHREAGRPPSYLTEIKNTVKVLFTAGVSILQFLCYLLCLLLSTFVLSRCWFFVVLWFPSWAAQSCGYTDHNKLGCRCFHTQHDEWSNVWQAWSKLPWQPLCLAVFPRPELACINARRQPVSRYSRGCVHGYLK